MANGNFAGGEGTERNPYLIEDAFDLDAIRNDLNAHYKLIRNINLDIPPFNEGKGWEPINDFSGTLDGNMYYIYKLYINGTSANNIGLFGSMINGAIVQNLKIENAYIESTYIRMGILVGDINKSSCKNIGVSGTLYGAATVSGIAGFGRNSNILNCYSDITIFSSKGSAGGILATAENETKVVIRNCISSGQIVGGEMVGGIVGNLSGSHSSHTIDNCYSMVDVNGKGGLIGREHSYKPNKVRNCFWNIDISKTSTSARGIGLTDEESKSAQVFIDAGWGEELNDDKGHVWILEDGQYPRLWFEKGSTVLVRVDNIYYTYQGGEFVEVEPTVENFEQYSVKLMELLTPDEQGIKPLMTLENPEIVHLTDKPNPQLYIKGFRDLRPFMESDNPKLLISSDVEPEIRVTYHPEPQLVLPDDDIKLRMLDKIHDFTIYTNKNNGGDVKIVYSTDSGRTWEVYRDGKAEEVNMANIKEVKEKGLTPDEFNSIGEVWDDIVVDDRIRFAYYLETATLNDIAEVDKLVVEMDMHGRWRKAEHINDYDYEYDNEHIYVTFYKDGSYKVNYQG